MPSHRRPRGRGGGPPRGPRAPERGASVRPAAASAAAAGSAGPRPAPRGAEAAAGAGARRRCGRSQRLAGRRRGRGARAGAAAPEAEGEGDNPAETRRELLFDYVQEVQPQVMEQFVQSSDPQVVDAMRQTITNMLGTLPPQFFEVTISTVGENLAQLMYSVMMTGYMFRNIQYRLDLGQSLSALPGELSVRENWDEHGEGEPEGEEYAPGSQKQGVEGQVIRWNHEKGAESISAEAYIDLLEEELELLREQIGTEQASEEENRLLSYLKSLEPTNLQDLTSSAGDDVLQAMNAFITRLIGENVESEDLKKTTSESTAVELARLLYWLMVVGYNLRNIEVRLDLENDYGGGKLLPDAAEGGEA